MAILLNRDIADFAVRTTLTTSRLKPYSHSGGVTKSSIKDAVLENYAK